MSKRDIYQEVTDIVLEALENDQVPWQKPWKVIGVPPTNLLTRKKYRGINVFLLGMAPYASPFWLSFKQADELLYKQWCRDNGKKINAQESIAEYRKLPLEERKVVEKGTKGHLAIFWKMIPNKGFEKGSSDLLKKNRQIPLLRHYTVFNVEQIPNLRIPEELQPEEIEDHDPIPAAQAIVDEYVDGPSITIGGDSASYYPAMDYVRTPELGQFSDPAEYYKTMYHELAHSTGHESRLNRKEVTDPNVFGSEPYSQEELVAEMTAAMLAGVAGLEFNVENTAAYIANWKAKLTDDPKLLVKAGAKAQKAADRILGVTWDAEDKDKS